MTWGLGTVVRVPDGPVRCRDTGFDTEPRVHDGGVAAVGDPHHGDIDDLLQRSGRRALSLLGQSPPRSAYLWCLDPGPEMRLGLVDIEDYVIANLAAINQSQREARRATPREAGGRASC
mgnify:FL=1